MSKFELRPSRDVDVIDMLCVVTIAALCFILLASVAYACFAKPNRETHAIQAQAVERGYAEWATDGKKIEFRWKE